MSEKNTLGNTGIQVIDKLEDKKIIDIVNQVSTRIMTAFPDNKLNYLDIYKTLLDTPMYYARVPKGLSKANYYYKDSSIYFSTDASFDEIDEFIFHECVHRLQERKDKRGNITRLGVCEVNELSVKATALNEGAIQFITGKAFNIPRKNITIYDINLPERTEYYPIITNIVSQLAFLLGEDILIDSTINGNENFKIEIIDNIGENEYSIIEKNLNEILKLKNEIAEIQKTLQIIDKWEGESNKKNKKIASKIQSIKNIYFETQNIIYTSFFDKLLQRAENNIEVNMIKNKLLDYKSMIGTDSINNDFNQYVIKFDNKANQRIEELKNKNALMIIKDNIFLKLVNKIKRLFTTSKNEYYK